MGVVLDSHTRSKDIVAVDLWHVGPVLVSRSEVVEVVVRKDILPPATRPRSHTGPRGLACQPVWTAMSGSASHSADWEAGK